jgi:CHAT domain-containing protein
MRCYLTFIFFSLCFSALQAQFKIPKNVSYQALDSLIDEHYNNNIDYAIATELLEFAVAKAKADSSENSYSYIKYLENLAFLYVELEQYPLADSLAEKTVALADKNKLTLLKAQSLNTRGLIASQITDFTKAETFYLQAKTEATKLEKHTVMIDILGNLALYYQKTGDMTQAKMLYTEAIEYHKKINGDAFQSCMLLSNAITIQSTENENSKKNTEAMIAALLQLFKTESSIQPFYPDALHNIASYYHKTENYTKATAYLEQAISLIDNSNSAGLSNQLFISVLLGHTYIKLGNFPKAKDLYLSALAISNQKTTSLSPDKFEWHTGLAEVYAHEQDQNNKRKYISLALQDASSIPNISGQPSAAWADSLTKHDYPTYLHLWHTIIVLDIAFSIATTKAEKIIIADVAIVLLKKSSDLKFHENDKLQALSKNYTWLNHIFEIIDLTHDVEKAFSLAETNKTVLLLQANNTSAAYQFGGLPQELADKERDLNAQYTAIEANLYEATEKNSQDSLRKKLNAIGIEIRQLKTEIESQYPQYAALKYEQQTPQIAEIQALLPQNTALIEYVVLDSATFIFYIDKEQTVLKKINISRPALEYKVKTLHKALSDYNYIVEQPLEAYNEYTQNAAAMYDLLLAPILPKNTDNKKISSLIIVPDGHLAYLPFEVFLSQANPTKNIPYKELPYLLKDYSISYSYSAQLWKNAATEIPRKNNGQLLAMAADYQGKKDSTIVKVATNNKETLRSPKHVRLRGLLSPLPAAKEEIKALSKTYKGDFMLGDEASESKFKQKAENYAVIHLAMHGILDEENPMLSSLAFTEEGDKAENNFLQVFEISKLKLQADLVVLSACETGYGKFEAGNGVASLARAFMYAGVNSLVVSLWAVNDGSTALLMHFFYKNLDSGLGKAEALRQAKLDYLNKSDGINAHPALWSPFVQIGNAQPVILEKQTTFNQYLLYTLAPISGFGLLFFYVRRKKMAA